MMRPESNDRTFLSHPGGVDLSSFESHVNPGAFGIINTVVLNVNPRVGRMAHKKYMLGGKFSYGSAGAFYDVRPSDLEMSVRLSLTGVIMNPNCSIVLSSSRSGGNVMEAEDEFLWVVHED